ncbi:hypothetical protein HIM_09135 [Hirsutella minnesotensis 3608]|uniref:Uncharacterized protein n=1 Tax=Hirsutella minnesotensis 3608 TaxID=1043627 RepID=A0A0F7ZGU4_9HYPO|nr:hypothetical protein HIM_09135 [Hirsutella minnesotensis 3608]
MWPVAYQFDKYGPRDKDKRPRSPSETDTAIRPRTAPITKEIRRPESEIDECRPQCQRGFIGTNRSSPEKRRGAGRKGGEMPRVLGRVHSKRALPTRR